MTTAVITRQFYGSGGMMGGGATSPTQTADNLFSMDVVEALLGVSEGPIEGLAPGGAQNWFIGDTPLINSDGNQNFDSFELIVRKGNELGQDIKSRLGGFSSSTSVQTELASNTPVVRQGSLTDIDYLDLRLAINRLGKTTDDGSFEHTGTVKIETKLTSASGWNPVKTVVTNPPEEAFNGNDSEVYIRLDKEVLVSGAEGDAIVFWQSTPPVVNSNLPVIWFDSSQLNRPKKQSGTSWVDYGYSVYSNSNWTFGNRTIVILTGIQNALVSTSAPGGRVRGDFWLNPSNNTVHFYNGSAWVKAGSTLSPGAFFGQGSTGGSSSLEAGVITITGKASGTYVKELRIPVNKVSNDTYDIRVTKTSPDNTTEEFFDVQWESFQQVKATVFNFPALATVQLTARASDQFSSIPDFWGIYRGRIVKVPSNYNTSTRIYSGLWDGTWKFAWTNNPAFIVNDLVEHDRYGMNAYYPVVLNKFDVYEAGQWCDTRRVDGNPRFTFNGLISDPRGCREAIEYICGTFGGRFFDDGNGSATIKIDKDDQAIALFSPENVASGLFTYSFTEATSRYNDITVTFINPELNWAEDRRRVSEPNHIAKYGRIPLNFIAVGCTNVAEAIARARYKLATGINEKTIVNFRTNRAGLYLKPYEVMLIADDDIENGMSGRVKAVTGARTITLRDPLYFEAGVSYSISFQVPNTSTVSFNLVELALTTTVGNVTTLTTTTNLPTLPEDAVFAINSSKAGSNPKAFRITKIDESDGDPDMVEIQGIEIDRQKWAYVDGLVTELVNPPTYVLNMSAKPKPASRLRITPHIVSKGGARTNNLIVEWDASNSNTVIKYKVFASRNNNQMSLVAETSGQAYEMTDVIPGEYLISVIASTSQMDSEPIYAEHRLIGDIRDISQVTNLKLLNETGNIFTTANPTFGWDPVLTPDHEDFVVRIFTTGNQMVRETSTRQTTFTYDQVSNLTDNLGHPLRTFEIRVAARDQFGMLTAFSMLTVTNPAPPAVVPVIKTSIRAATITWDLTAISDAAGVKLWVSEVDNFVPSDSTLVYHGPGTSHSLFGDANRTYYVRMSAYDTLSDRDLILSLQYDFAPEAIDLTALDGEFSSVMDFVLGEDEADLGARLDELQRLVEEANLRATTGVLTDWDDRRTIRNELELFQGEAEAKFLAISEVRVNDNAASAEQLTELSARFDTTETVISELDNVLSSADAALANSISIITARVGDAETAITTASTASTTRDTALGTRIDNVTARIGTAEASVTTETAARVSADGTLANQQTTLSTKYNEMSATGRVGFQVAAGVAGVTARYAVVLRANTANLYSEAGFFLDILANGSTRMAIKADLFALLNSSGGYLSSPFYVEGGNVFIDSAYIKNLTSDHIAVNSLNANRLVAGSITADKLAAGSITADRIQAGTITADRLILNGINTDRIAADAVSNYFSVGANFQAPGANGPYVGVTANVQVTSGKYLQFNWGGGNHVNNSESLWINGSQVSTSPGVYSGVSPLTGVLTIQVKVYVGSGGSDAAYYYYINGVAFTR